MMKGTSIDPPVGHFVKEDRFAGKQWCCVQYLLEQYWAKWKEYVLSLQACQKWQKSRRNIAVGDVVSMAEDNLPRYHWRQARVREVILSDDGFIRKVKLVTFSPSSKSSTLEQPIQKLVVHVEAH